ncbi:MAG TPA: carbonic anhydrase [bacterium]|nr:carbonic anhydrase [bacterium]
MPTAAEQQRVSRRQFVKAVAAGIVTAGIWGDLVLSGQAATVTGPPVSAADALQRLKDGNRRAAAGRFTIGDRLVSQRVRTAAVQRPFAAILGCADSRVPVELIFDHGIGELFVVRVAGNTAGTLVKGSIEYAVEHLHVPLLVVLGHQRCGAVEAAIESVQTGRPAPGHIDSLLAPIRPVVRRLGNRPDLLAEAVTANARTVAETLRRDDQLAEHVASRSLTVTSAVYSLDTGLVRWL